MVYFHSALYTMFVPSTALEVFKKKQHFFSPKKTLSEELKKICQGGTQGAWYPSLLKFFHWTRQSILSSDSWLKRDDWARDSWDTTVKTDWRSKQDLWRLSE